MATFTLHDEDRIVFETVGDDRAPGLLLLVHGAIFAAASLSWLPGALSRRDVGLLLALLSALVGLVEIRYGLTLLLKSEWLIIDLHRRSYRGRRGVPFWGERFDGPLGDFAQIRLVVEPCGRRGRHRRTVVEWVWREEEHRPFRVLRWGRARSFRLPMRWGVGDRLDFSASLRAVAKDAGLPLAIPSGLLDGIGLEAPEQNGSHVPP